MNDNNNRDKTVYNVYTILIEYAASRQTISYTELANEYNRRFKEHQADVELNPRGRAKNLKTTDGETYIGPLVGAVNNFPEVKNNGILLSSIVVGSSNLPGDGFDWFIKERYKEDDKWLAKQKKDTTIWKILIKNIQNEVFDKFANRDKLLLDVRKKKEHDATDDSDNNYDSTIVRSKIDAIEHEVRKPISDSIKNTVYERLKKERGRIECEGKNCQNRLSFERASFKCEEDRIYLEFHHIQEIQNDGDHNPNNLQLLCPNCHREKHFGKKL